MSQQQDRRGTVLDEDEERQFQMWAFEQMMRNGRDLIGEAGSADVRGWFKKNGPKDPPRSLEAWGTL